MKNSYFKGLFWKFVTLLLLLILSFCTKKSVNPKEHQTMTISPAGGEYTFDDGIKLRVPAGAVNEEQEITLKKINPDQLVPIFVERGVPIDNLLACIKGEPDGLVFNYPVQVILSVDLEPGELPIVHEADLTTGAYSMMQTVIKGDPEQDTLSISVTHFSFFFTEILREIEQFFGGCGEIECRCGGFEMTQSDKDYICYEGEHDCQIAESELYITYPECGPEVETSIVREVTDECSPNLKLTAAKPTLKKGEQTDIKALVKLSCEPMEKQSVDFSVSGPGFVDPTYSETDEDGAASTILTAGDETGTITVTARSTVSYYAYEIFASAQGMQEIGHGRHITKELSETIQVEVIEPDQVWSGTIDYEVYTTYTPILEHATYSMDYTLYVRPANIAEERDVTGFADASQDVNLSIGDECWAFQNVNAPNTLELIIDGIVLDDSLNLFLSLKKYDESQFYDYTSCLTCVFEPPPICTSGAGYISGLLIGNHPLNQLIIPLAEGTYSSLYGFDITSHPEGTNSHITFEYTITLNRDD